MISLIFWLFLCMVISASEEHEKIAGSAPIVPVANAPNPSLANQIPNPQQQAQAQAQEVQRAQLAQAGQKAEQAELAELAQAQARRATLTNDRGGGTVSPMPVAIGPQRALAVRRLERTHGSDLQGAAFCEGHG